VKENIMANLDFWSKVKQPPATALKQIAGGRLKNMTDINPQWRYEALTEHFGMCGVGWKWEIVELWAQDLENKEIMAHAKIHLYVKVDGQWSDPIPGIGGNKLVEKEKEGYHVSDEGYKMAVTDALSVAAKMLGIGSDIYMGRWDGSKYKDAEDRQAQSDRQRSKDADRGEGASRTAARGGDPASFGDIVEQARQFVIGFGRYKDNPQPLCNIPAAYLKWLLGSMQKKEDEGETLSQRDKTLRATIGTYLGAFPDGEVHSGDGD
jgi:hypothetical protein